MRLVHRLVFRVSLALPLAVLGCSGGGPAEVASPAAAKTAGGENAEPRDPIAESAHQFLAAIVAGDTPRATSLLTPDAIAQFEMSQQAFASPDIGAPDFRVGEVRRIDADRAAVECVLTDASGDASMCCLLKRINEAWRVSGVAYEIDPNQPPVILNFEQPDLAPPDAGQFVDQPPAAGPAARTAEAPTAPPLR